MKEIVAVLLGLVLSACGQNAATAPWAGQSSSATTPSSNASQSRQELAVQDLRLVLPSEWVAEKSMVNTYRYDDPADALDCKKVQALTCPVMILLELDGHEARQIFQKGRMVDAGKCGPITKYQTSDIATGTVLVGGKPAAYYENQSCTGDGLVRTIRLLPGENLMIIGLPGSGANLAPAPIDSLLSGATWK
jgi:hypothetical protein